jgi:hypothetical protein
MTLDKLTSKIFNNIVAGLSGMTANVRFTMDEIEDSVISERQLVIKEYSAKNLLPKRDLLLSVNCITVDCESIDRCPCSPVDSEKLRHIEVPQILNDYGAEGVDFIGSTDRNISFTVYTDQGWRNHKYRKRGGNEPYVWIDTTPNKNNMNDGFIFNAPFVKTVSISAIFKDPRQLEDYGCCGDEVDNWSYIDTDIEKRVTEKYIRYYRQMATANTANDQTVKP